MHSWCPIQLRASFTGLGGGILVGSIGSAIRYHRIIIVVGHRSYETPFVEIKTHAIGVQSFGSGIAVQVPFACQAGVVKRRCMLLEQFGNGHLRSV